MDHSLETHTLAATAHSYLFPQHQQLCFAASGFRNGKTSLFILLACANALYIHHAQFRINTHCAVRKRNMHASLGLQQTFSSLIIIRVFRLHLSPPIDPRSIPYTQLLARTLARQHSPARTSRPLVPRSHPTEMLLCIPKVPTLLVESH